MAEIVGKLPGPFKRRRAESGYVSGFERMLAERGSVNASVNEVETVSKNNNLPGMGRAARRQTKSLYRLQLNWASWR